MFDNKEETYKETSIEAYKHKTKDYQQKFYEKPKRPLLLKLMFLFCQKEEQLPTTHKSQTLSKDPR